MQAKPKVAPRGGVSSSMLILEPDALGAWDCDECCRSKG